MKTENKMSDFITYPRGSTEENLEDSYTEYKSIDDVKITEMDWPPRFREPQFDMVLIYARNDEKIALVFKDILEKFVKLDDLRYCKVCVLDREDNLQYIRGKFQHLADAVKRSTYMFLFMSKNFVTDSWAELQGDECLQESIDNPEKKWCVIPIHCLPKQKGDYEVPFGLRALKGVRCDRILTKTNKVFNENLDVNTLKSENLDPYFIRQMSGLFNIRLRDKLERERKQKRETENWIREEKLRRYQAAKEREKEERLKEEEHQRKLALIEQMNEEDIQKRREEISNMTVDDVWKPPPQEPEPEPYRNNIPASSQPMAVNIYVDSRYRVGMDDECDSGSTPIIQRYNNDSTNSSLSPSDNTFYTSPPRSHNMNIQGSPNVERPLQNVFQTMNRVPTENEDSQGREPQEDSVSETSVDASNGRKTDSKLDSRETPAKIISPYASVQPDTKPHKIDNESFVNKTSIVGQPPLLQNGASCGSKLSSVVSGSSQITVDGPCDSDARSTMMNSQPQSKNFISNTPDSSVRFYQGSVASSAPSSRGVPGQSIKSPICQPNNGYPEQPQHMIGGQYPHISAEEYRSKLMMQGAQTPGQGQPGMKPSDSAPGNLQMEQLQAQLAQMYPNMPPMGAMPNAPMYPANMPMYHPGAAEMNPGMVPGMMHGATALQMQAMLMQQMKQIQDMQMMMMKQNQNQPVYRPPDSTPSPVIDDGRAAPEIKRLFPTISGGSSSGIPSNNSSSTSGASSRSSRSRDYRSGNSSDDSISLAASLYLAEDGGRMESPDERSGSLELPEHPFQPQPAAKRVAELSANRNASLAVDESLLPETPQTSVLVSNLQPAGGLSSVTPASDSSGYGTGDDMIFQSIRGGEYKDIKLNLHDIPTIPEAQSSLPDKCDSSASEVSLTNSSVGGSTFLSSNGSNSLLESLSSDGASTPRRNSSQMSSVREQTLKSSNGLPNYNVNNNNQAMKAIFKSVPDADLETSV